jgi:ribosome-associated protein
VRAVAEHIQLELKKEGVTVHHAEGLEQGRWALLDFVDFVVHVFHPTLRQFYQLERLWGDARELRIDGPVGAAAGASATSAEATPRVP